jgi:hypothetical protein
MQTLYPRLPAASSFLYPRTITVTRPPVTTQAGGAIGYGGDQPVTDTIILSGISAAVQSDRIGRVTPSNLPASSGLPLYKILIPATEAPLGTINKNDIITDDLGVRYQVHDPYWTPLGFQLRATMMAM